MLHVDFWQFVDIFVGHFFRANACQCVQRYKRRVDSLQSAARRHCIVTLNPTYSRIRMLLTDTYKFYLMIEGNLAHNAFLGFFATKKHTKFSVGQFKFKLISDCWPTRNYFYLYFQSLRMKVNCFYRVISTFFSSNQNYANMNRRISSYSQKKHIFIQFFL